MMNRVVMRARGLRELAMALPGLLVLVALQGCVSSEPVRRVPTVNLSPERMDFAFDTDESSQTDFGLSLATNESDSLENLEVLPGLRVLAVSPGSAAAQAGIQPRDVLLELNGTPTNRVDAFVALTEALSQDSFTVKALRGTTVFETRLLRPQQVLKSEPEELYRLDQVKSRAGYSTQVFTDAASGQAMSVAEVVEVMPGSPLATAGVKPGDLIAAVDGRPISSAQDLVTRLHNNHDFGDSVMLTLVTRNPGARSITDVNVRLWEPESYISRVSLWPLLSYRASVAPDETEFSLINILGFSALSYKRSEQEKEYGLLFLFRFVSENAGELTDVTEQQGAP